MVRELWACIKVPLQNSKALLKQSLNETLDAAATLMELKLNENTEKAPL